MTPNIKNITLAAATLLLAACSDTPDARYSVGSEDNEVRISAGIASSPRGIESRAALAGHYAFTEGTCINLHVEGYWAGKSPEKIEKTAIFRAASDDDADNINAISYLSGEQIYWDDFGTADPGNTANRSKGLGVLAVAIDRVKTETTIADEAWLSSDAATDLPWSVVTDGTNSFKNDILVANNLYDASSTTPQMRYTFDEQKAATPEESRLDFKHVLSKITFVLTAGNGFPVIFGNPSFIYDPVVNLTRNKTGETNPEWCYTSGKINIKTATATFDPTSQKIVKLDDIDRSGAKFTHEAIIYPGSQFGADNDVVAQINADGNIYYVTAKQIRAAIDADASHTGTYNTLPGYNYIFQVTVNKTDIKVTATISDWKTVTAAEETPKIVVSADVGKQDDKTKTLDKFRFYRNEDGALKTGKYIALADAENPQASDIADGSTIWNFYNVDGSTPTPLYWPNHTTHYFFRGVYPYNTAVTDGGGTSTYIQAENGAFGKSTSTYYNLMIGAPEIASGTKCDNPDHTPVDMSTEGICARTGKINLNFRYMMAQVEVKLKTTTGDDKVILDGNTTVELVNTIKSRRIYLGTRSIGYESLPRETYPMTQTADVKVFHDAIVPQSLPDEVQLKITVKDGTESDVYYAVVNKIKVGGYNITKWEAGKHYVYTLNIKKTGISVTATITDWTTAEGSDDIWL